MIYLDHAATTPLLPQARAAVLRGFDLWANPSSPHGAGRAARAALEEARGRVKAALGWDGEVIFTSGASEALGLALRGAQVARVIVSAVEHEAVFRQAPEARVIAMRGGLVDDDGLDAALAEDGPALVAVQYINSETGTVLLPGPEEDRVIAATHARHGVFLCDASQMAFQRRLPQGIDMAVISGHKIGGPVGIGALLLRDFGLLRPDGGQERGYRAGTENLPGALGLAAALEVGEEVWQTSADERRAFRDRLTQSGHVWAPGDQCSHIIALASPRFSASVLLMRLDGMGFAVSVGSACSSGTLKPSRVLQAFLDPEAGITPELIARTVRVSIGWNTRGADLDAFAEAWEALHA